MSLLVNYIKRTLSRPHAAEDCKMVIVVRSDIPMGKGKVAAQCAHAALECYRQTLNDKKSERIFHSWLQDGQPKIVLKIPSEDELKTLAINARYAGLITALIRDAGRTQLTPGTITVLGIGPAPKTVVSNLTANLKLL